VKTYKLVDFVHGAFLLTGSDPFIITISLQFEERDSQEIHSRSDLVKASPTFTLAIKLLAAALGSVGRST
jgi:hypothetical protein